MLLAAAAGSLRHGWDCQDPAPATLYQSRLLSLGFEVGWLKVVAAHTSYPKLSLVLCATTTTFKRSRKTSCQFFFTGCLENWLAHLPTDLNHASLTLRGSSLYLHSASLEFVIPMTPTAQNLQQPPVRTPNTVYKMLYMFWEPLNLS